MSAKAIVIASKQEGIFFLEQYEEDHCIVEFTDDPVSHHKYPVDFWAIYSPREENAMTMTEAEANAFVERHRDVSRKFGTWLAYRLI